MKIRFINARILTMREENNTLLPIIENGELHTDGSRIAYVGDKLPETENASGKGECFDRTIDCRGNLLMPGFKNAHTHTAMTIFRSAADDLPLAEWLNNVIFPHEAMLTAEDIYTLNKLGIAEYMTSGITSALDMYLTPESIAKSSADMDFRMVLTGGVNNFSQSVELLEKWYNELNGKNDLISFQLGFHAEYTCSEELIGRVAQLAHDYHAPVTAHVSETAGEVQGCIDRYGMTPVRFLAEKGIFDYGGTGYHLVHTTPDDRKVLKEKKINVVSNPGSNTKLASGIAPISDYLREGIRVGLGTDGPSSNNCLDMFREMFLVTGLAKLREQDAAAVPAQEVLKMATVNGAKIMGIDADTLEAGKLADMIMLDLGRPNMQPVQNIACNIVYSGSKENVCMTMVGGKILYDKFEGEAKFHFAEPVEDIYRDCAKIRDRILG